VAADRHRDRGARPVRPRAWPGVTLGAFLANVTADEPVGTAVGIALGNTLEAVSAAWCLRQVAFQPALARLRDAWRWRSSGRREHDPRRDDRDGQPVRRRRAALEPPSGPSGGRGGWATRSAPSSSRRSCSCGRHGSPARPKGDLLESAGLLLATLSMGLAVFVVHAAAPLSGYPLHYVVFPLVIWAALRFGPRGTGDRDAARVRRSRSGTPSAAPARSPQRRRTSGSSRCSSTWRSSP
jgi:hypothetical protein